MHTKNILILLKK